MNRKFVALILMSCLARVGMAQKETPSTDTLEDVTAVGERERQRQPPLGPRVENPDGFTVTRIGTRTDIRLQFHEPQRDVQFTRTSVARLPAESGRAPVLMQGDRLVSVDGPRFTSVRLQLEADVDEADGLPALITFDKNTSLINVDYLRLREPTSPTIVTVTNAIHLQTRKCMPSLGLAVDDQVFPATYILSGNKLGDCQNVLNGREGDLLFAEGVPERLRQQIRELYDPLYTYYSRRLGSEPGLLFVVWRPESPRQDFRLVRSWNRTNVLVLNGAAWSQDAWSAQEDALWEALSREQLERRLQWEARPNAFTSSAVEYLSQLSRLERQRASARPIVESLPSWLANCAREWNARARPQDGARFVYAYQCGALVQFVYDAVIRSSSRGRDSIYDNWRTLLDATAKRGEYGVRPEMFLSSSLQARSLAQGILGGDSLEWSQFLVALTRYNVELDIESTSAGSVLHAKPLKYFDQPNP